MILSLSKRVARQKWLTIGRWLVDLVLLSRSHWSSLSIATSAAKLRGGTHGPTASMGVSRGDFWRNQLYSKTQSARGHNSSLTCNHVFFLKNWYTGIAVYPKPIYEDMLIGSTINHQIKWSTLFSQTRFNYKVSRDNDRQMTTLQRHMWPLQEAPALNFPCPQNEPRQDLHITCRTCRIHRRTSDINFLDALKKIWVWNGIDSQRPLIFRSSPVRSVPRTFRMMMPHRIIRKRLTAALAAWGTAAADGRLTSLITDQPGVESFHLLRCKAGLTRPNGRSCALGSTCLIWQYLVE